MTDNKDDHCKNLSFFVNENPTGRYSWHLAPAYDLTLCTEGYNGEHATSVNGSGHPTLRDMIAIESYIVVDFADAPDELWEAVEHISDRNYFFTQLQFIYNVRLIERHSVIIFDEIQKCPTAR
ncbi:MAG: HipA domain-containing protein, partial [Bacteroidaceae bacterium]|nr:HipA domain-containing protein [Bacteroidaceae bacterium]